MIWQGSSCPMTILGLIWTHPVVALSIPPKEEGTESKYSKVETVKDLADDDRKFDKTGAKLDNGKGDETETVNDLADDDGKGDKTGATFDDGKGDKTDCQ